MADFFDKLADGFNRGVATVSTGSKNMLEKSKINTIIKNLEEEKRQLLEFLGNKIYCYYKENPDGEIPRELAESFCVEIDNRFAQMAEQRRKITELDAVMAQVKGTNTNSAPVYGAAPNMAPNTAPAQNVVYAPAVNSVPNVGEEQSVEKSPDVDANPQVDAVAEVSSETEAPVEPVTAPRICYCGHANSATAKFCSKCGNSL